MTQWNRSFKKTGMFVLFSACLTESDPCRMELEEIMFSEISQAQKNYGPYVEAKNGELMPMVTSGKRGEGAGGQGAGTAAL